VNPHTSGNSLRIRPPRFQSSVSKRGWILAAVLTVIGSSALGDPAWKAAYDPLEVKTLHLELTEADWDRVRFDQPMEGETEGIERAPAWFHATGEAPIQVEIRRKGQTDPALPEEGNPQKVSLKIDINALVAGQRWHGLRKLSLENGGDAGPLQEGFAWQIHRMAADSGYYRYDAANAAWIKLYINGSYKGVFVSTEQRDEQLLRNRDLYSPFATWLYKIDGGIYNEVGEGDSPTRAHLNFAPFNSGPGGGNQGGTPPDLDVDLPQWIDMESMLTLAACEAFVENNDGLFTHSGKNSFAADFNPPDLRRRIYFPWDMDASIKDGRTGIYGNGSYQTALLGHPWFGRVYEHTFRELLQGPLSAASLHAFLNQLEPVLAPALDSDPYAAPDGGAAASIQSLRNWVTTRTLNIPTRLIHPHVPRPTFSHPGGEVVSGFNLTMSAPEGQIYYTTDGRDPRLPGGATVPGALLYAGPVMIDRNVKFTARTLSGGQWSGLATEAAFQLAPYGSPLRISEIMYNPKDPNAFDSIDNSAYEFLEMHNTGAAPVDLSGCYFEGISFSFPQGSSVAAGGRIVLVRNASAFSNRYPGVARHGIYLGGLSAGGEKITLKNANGTTLVSVEYDDDPPWVISPDGMGYSLVNRNPDGDPDDASNWSASRDIGGSPGAADPVTPYATGAVFHEVLANPAAPFEDAIELHNPSGASIDIGGWFLSNEARNASGNLDPGKLKRFKIPVGTILQAGGYAAFYQAEFQQGNPLVPFELSLHGGRVYLSSADAAANLTGHIVALEFPATETNVAYGSVSTSDGPRETLLETPTFGAVLPPDLAAFRTGDGAANSAPRIGPVVISEIHYHPLNTGSEFLELHNRSAAPVSIAGWDIDGIAGFEFPAGTTLPAGGFTLIVDSASTTAAAFRSERNIAAEVPVFATTMTLEDSGEALRLEKPNPVSLQPDILLERVRYNDKAPWTGEADGAGPSLERIPPGRFGNEPLHWKAVTLHGTPGLLGSANGGFPISRASFWDYHAGPAPLDAGWKTPLYNATAWLSTNCPAGYGETFITGIIPYGSDPSAKYPTTFFRKSFVLGDPPASLATLVLSLLCDDGVVVYLNGSEIVRRSMPDGAIAYATLATADTEAGSYEDIDLMPYRHLLIQGTNLLAVEVHQFAPQSSDLVWDAGLTYTLAADPSDSDQDGLPSEWESAYGFNDQDPGDAALDFDGDGQSNLAEFMAGTSPVDGSSFFHIHSATRTPGGAKLTWGSVPGKTYKVGYSPDLKTWFSFGEAGDVTATGTTCEYIDSTAGFVSARFYRVEVVP
jgi:hypothetical protein